MDRINEDYNLVEVKYKLKEEGTPPKKGIKFDFGTDLYLREDIVIIPSAIQATMAGVGIHTEFDPTKHGMLISLRSSMSKVPISMANHVGVIEGTYRGEIMVPLRNNLNTRNNGDVNPSTTYLYWDEKTKKLIKRETKELSKEILKDIYDKLEEEFELFEGDPISRKLLSAYQKNKKVPKGTIVLKKGTRVAQAYMVPKYAIEWVETEQLSETKRGSGGFGSTNK